MADVLWFATGKCEGSYKNGSDIDKAAQK